MNILSKEDIDSFKISSDFIEENLLAFGYCAWDGLKKTGEKGVVIAAYRTNEDQTTSLVSCFIPKSELINTWNPFYIKQRDALIEIVGEEEASKNLAIEDAFIRPILMIESYDPAKEFTLSVTFATNLLDDQNNNEQICPISFELFQIIEPRITPKECFLEYQGLSASKRRKNTKSELVLEVELYQWLLSKGVQIERQVSTVSKHRLDLWIPGRMMLELKAGKITGDDVCQAIDYQSTYDRQILLVGKGMTDAASRGITGFNRVTGTDSIVFVSWEAVRVYLGAVLGI